MANSSSPKIVVERDGQALILEIDQIENFSLVAGDRIRIDAPPGFDGVTQTPDGCFNIKLAENRSVRLPQQVELYEYKGYTIPSHLITLTGAGPDTLEPIGKAHIHNYKKVFEFRPDMTVLEIGCGIGRDALQFLDLIDARGHYIGIDVTRDSIEWCCKNIGRDHPNFEFHHFDAKHELYNPLGAKTSLDFKLPVADRSVDFICLGSVFTHLFEDEIVHYMHEIERVLKRGGMAYATFFLYSKETIGAARQTDLTPFKLRFEHIHGDGCYINDPAYPTGAVAYKNRAMRRMIRKGGLRLVGPYLKGWWSGLHEVADDGQEVALLTPMSPPQKFLSIFGINPR